jgi:hypothetical protein
MYDVDALHVALLQNKIWKCPGVVLEITPWGISSYRVVFFSEIEGVLEFVQMAMYTDVDKLYRLIKLFEVKPCGTQEFFLKDSTGVTGLFTGYQPTTGIEPATPTLPR